MTSGHDPTRIDALARLSRDSEHRASKQSRRLSDTAFYLGSGLQARVRPVASCHGTVRIRPRRSHLLVPGNFDSA